MDCGELMSLSNAATFWGRKKSAKSRHIRNVVGPEKRSAYLRRVLMSIKSCCDCNWRNAACYQQTTTCHILLQLLLHAVKTGNIIMRQTLNCRSYLCPELKMRHGGGNFHCCLGAHFHFRNWQKAQPTSRIESQSRIVNAISRWLPLVLGFGGAQLHSGVGEVGGVQATTIIISK